MKILIAEDDPTSSLLLCKTLTGDGYEVVACGNGRQALDAARRGRFDAVITDWMMPEMDGITVVRRIRAELEDPPPILVVTALTSADARRHAIEAGADDYLAKPYQPREILSRLRACILRSVQPVPQPTPRPVPRRSIAGGGAAVGIAASTGGPEALRQVLPQLDPRLGVPVLLVLHGPHWMLETFAQAMQSRTSLNCSLAVDGAPLRPGDLLICPGDVHMAVDAQGSRVVFDDSPPENYVRPAADPLFRSMATAFGNRAVAVILTGMGRDGSLGAQQIHAAGGRVIVQDPSTAVASAMPRTAVGLGIVDEIKPVHEIGAAISRAVTGLGRERLVV